jgi:hypothetical protein
MLDSKPGSARRATPTIEAQPRGRNVSIFQRSRDLAEEARRGVWVLFTSAPKFPKKSKLFLRTLRRGRGLKWTGVDRSGPEWTGVDRSGPEWTGVDRSNPGPEVDRSVLVRSSSDPVLVHLDEQSEQRGPEVVRSGVVLGSGL